MRFLWFATRPAFELFGVGGALLIDPFVASPLPLAVLDVTGTLAIPTAVPLDAALAGATIVEQTVQLTAAAIAFAPPALLAILP